MQLTSLFKKFLPEKKSLISDDVLRQYFRDSPTTFWGDGSLKQQLISARFPDQQELLSMADATVEGQLRFWQPWHMEQTSILEPIRTPIDWQAIPNGDQEWTHALLRLYHLLDLAVAFDKTQHKIYLQTLENHLRSFTDARYNNQKIISPNLLDAALRINHLIRTFDLIKKTELVSPETVSLIINIIIDETDYLVTRLGTKVGNWEFFITIAILMSSVYLSEICEIEFWQQEGEKRLQEIIDSELLGDGNLIEACPMYHGQCILLLLDYMMLLKNNRIAVPSYISETIDVMMKSLLRIADPQGRIPRLGDSDALEIEYIANYADQVTGDNYNITEKKVSSLRIEDFNATGWLISRFTLQDKTGYFLFDISGKPPLRRSWHSHADDLQFMFHDGVHDVFIDPGRFTYSSYFKRKLPVLQTNYKPVGMIGFLYHLIYPQYRELNKRDWRAHFRHTVSHNTVCCGSKMQRGYTNLEEYPTKVERLFHYQEGSMFYSGAQLIDNDYWLDKNTRKEDSIRKESESCKHIRTIFGFTPHVIVISDILNSDKPCQWTGSYHVASNVSIQNEKNNVFILTTPSNTTHLLQLHSNCQGGEEVSIEADWNSMIYNQKEQSSIIRLRLENKKRAYISSIILPAIQEDQQKYKSEVIYSPEKQNFSEVVKITSDTKEINIYYNPHPGIVKSYNNISSDALVTLTVKENQQYTYAGYFQGSQLQIGDKKYGTLSPDTNLFQQLD